MPVLFNQSTHRDNKVFGGYEATDEATVAYETSLIAKPKAGQIITVDGTDWRVQKLSYGKEVTHLTLVSPDAT